MQLRFFKVQTMLNNAFKSKLQYSYGHLLPSPIPCIVEICKAGFSRSQV